MTTPILCIGSAHWDLIGRVRGRQIPGSDVPGRVRRWPGGVALNVAIGLARHGAAPVLLSSVGLDEDGDALLRTAGRLGIDTEFVHRSPDLPTDSYLAVEDDEGLIAAVADTRSLDQAEEAVLAPLRDGRLGTPEAGFSGAVVIDGNLSERTLCTIAAGNLLAGADLRVVPASAAKVARIRPFLKLSHATIYLNLDEAGRLIRECEPDAVRAAEALAGDSEARVIVTDRSRAVAMAGADGTATATPPSVAVRRVTGAGDAFAAGHIAAELLAGRRGGDALTDALAASARHVAEEDAA